MRAWWLVIAALAAIACGPSDGTAGGGQRSFPVPDPDAVDADGDGVPAIADCDDSDPTVWTTVLAYRDLDGDGHGAGPLRPVCAGAALPAGWSSDADDCDDADPGRWKTFMLYADEDLDGVGAGPLVGDCTPGFVPAGWASEAGDCAPADGTRWRELAYDYRDADGDLAWVASAGVVCSGSALPPGYATVGDPAAWTIDCDDADPGAWRSVLAWRDDDGDGVGEGSAATLCIGERLPSPWVEKGGDCAPGDASRWQLLSYAGVDRDGDGFTVAQPGTLCTGASLPDPYRASLNGNDCDDADPQRWQLLWGYVDADGDGFGAGPRLELCTGASLPPGIAAAGGDCAPLDPTAWATLHYAFRDADGDGRTLAAAGDVCAGAALPPGYSNVASGNDCDDANPAVWASVTAFLDADGDGVGAGEAVTFCTTGAVPQGYAPVSGDCAPDDPARWRFLAYAGVDRDGDGSTVKEPGQVCAGESLPDPYRATLQGNDCDDADPARWRWVVVYRDADGDGVGAGPRQVPCVGATLPSGTSVLGFDEDDADPAVQAGADDEELLLEL